MDNNVKVKPHFLFYRDWDSMSKTIFFYSPTCVYERQLLTMSRISTWHLRDTEDPSQDPPGSSRHTHRRPDGPTYPHLHRQSFLDLMNRNLSMGITLDSYK